MAKRTEFPRRQKGAALLLLMLVVTVGAAAILVAKLSRHSARLVDVGQTGEALALARDALLAYAASYGERFPGMPAQLPCPDIDGSGTTLDGESHTAGCGPPGVTVIGRLPWRTLGVPALRDGAGACLWYVVSGEYKSAGPATSAMINPDSNGQLVLYDAETGTIVAGQAPDDRLAALVIAAGQALPGQNRQAVSQPGQQCSDDFRIGEFLDTDPGTGVSNAALSGSVGVDAFVRASGESAAINDRVASISRLDLALLVHARHDFESRIRDLTRTIAACIAEYGSTNPGGANDRRLPWPAPVTLADYRADSEYDDVGGGVLSGRLADRVDDSGLQTGNPVARLLSDCDGTAVPAWDPAARVRWQHWKDHFFYFVSDSFSPDSAVPNSCIDCVTVNGAGPFAAVVVFAGRRLGGLGQRRDAPPVDADTKHRIDNYLEAANSASHPYVSGSVDLEARPAATDFNDILYCVDPSMNVVACG